MKDNIRVSLFSVKETINLGEFYVSNNKVYASYPLTLAIEYMDIAEVGRSHIGYCYDILPVEQGREVLKYAVYLGKDGSVAFVLGREVTFCKIVLYDDYRERDTTE